MTEYGVVSLGRSPYELALRTLMLFFPLFNLLVTFKGFEAPVSHLFALFAIPKPCQGFGAFLRSALASAKTRMAFWRC